MHPAWLKPDSRRALNAAALACTALMLGACTTPPPAPPPAPAPPDPVEVALRKSITEIGAMPAFTRNADTRAPAPVMQGATITARFAGEAHVLLQRIAEARNVTFKVRGPKPHLPLPVHVDATAVPYEEFLRDVGFQFGQRADLILSNDAIEIRYRGQP